MRYGVFLRSQKGPKFEKNFAKWYNDKFNFIKKCYRISQELEDEGKLSEIFFYHKKEMEKIGLKINVLHGIISLE